MCLLSTQPTTLSTNPSFIRSTYKPLAKTTTKRQLNLTNRASNPKTPHVCKVHTLMPHPLTVRQTVSSNYVTLPFLQQYPTNNHFIPNFYLTPSQIHDTICPYANRNLLDVSTGYFKGIHSNSTNIHKVKVGNAL